MTLSNINNKILRKTQRTQKLKEEKLFRKFVISVYFLFSISAVHLSKKLFFFAHHQKSAYNSQINNNQNNNRSVKFIHKRLNVACRHNFIVDPTIN